MQQHIDDLFHHIDAFDEARDLVSSLINGSVYSLTSSTHDMIADWQSVMVQERKSIDYHQAEIVRLLQQAKRIQ